MTFPSPLSVLLRRGPGSSSRRLAPVEYRSPLQPPLKTAILSDGFRENRRVRAFPRGWNEEAARFRPAVIAGDISELLRLAENWNPAWERPTHALVVFTPAGAPPLNDSARDTLWNSFGLPVFEYLLDQDCRLLAAECDAHQGLHLLDNSAAHPGWDLSSEPCSCANPAPRLLAARQRLFAVSA
jgi:hypothetical protein